MELDKEVIDRLKEKGFKEKRYVSQGNIFYTIDITSKESITKLIKKYYKIEEDEDIRTGGVVFTIEIREGGGTPQWVFTGGYDKYGILRGLEEFLTYVESIERLLGGKLI